MKIVSVVCPWEEYQMKKDGAGGPVLYAYADKYGIADSLMGDSNPNRGRIHPYRIMMLPPFNSIA
jgi:hypothetical protein